MKKFLLYSLVITMFVVVMGTMFIFGIFDIRDGSVNLIGYNTQVNPVDMHNEIVDSLHTIALNSQNAHDLYFELNESSDLNDLEKTVNIIEDKMFKLKKLVLQYGDEVMIDGHKIYGNTLEKLVNNYLKSLTFFSQKGLLQENIDSFKNSLEFGQNELNTAHNTFTEILNS